MSQLILCILHILSVLLYYNIIIFLVQLKKLFLNS